MCTYIYAYTCIQYSAEVSYLNCKLAAAKREEQAIQHYSCNHVCIYIRIHIYVLQCGGIRFKRETGRSEAGRARSTAAIKTAGGASRQAPRAGIHLNAHLYARALVCVCVSVCLSVCVCVCLCVHVLCVYVYDVLECTDTSTEQVHEEV